MNETVIILLSMVVACGLGAFVIIIFARGYIGQWMKAKRSGGILVEEISESGDRAKLTVATPDAKKEAYTYKGMDGQQHILTPRGVLRLNRVRHALVLERDSSPLIPKKVVESEDEKGKFSVFEHWDDTREINNIIIRALTKPKIKSGPEALNIMMFVVSAALGAAVMYFVMSQGMMG